MRHHRHYVTMLVITLAMVASGACQLVAPEGDQIVDLEEDIRSRVDEMGAGGQVFLGDLAGVYEWTRLVVVGPYPEDDDFARAAGFGWNVNRAASGVTEGNTVAFATDERVLAWGTLAGDVYFLPEEDTSIAVARDQATFRIVLEDDGQSRRLDFVGP